MKDSRDVELQYFGHASFLWITPDGVRILIDPFGNSPEKTWFLKPFPRTACDILLITHPHFDHNAFERIEGRPSIIRNPIALEGDDFYIRGVMGRHAKGYGEEFDQENLIFVLEIGGIVFCHIGDNRADLGRDILKAIGLIDVLLVPIDGLNHLLNDAEVERLIQSLRPLIVIPMHYHIPDLMAPKIPLGGIEKWVSQRVNARNIESSTVKISSLPEQRETWVFRDYVR
jgi:L-ascorbate metabolism protein UlaG (beta-lactamase superfamily)